QPMEPGSGLREEELIAEPVRAPFVQRCSVPAHQGPELGISLTQQSGTMQQPGEGALPLECFLCGHAGSITKRQSAITKHPQGAATTAVSSADVGASSRTSHRPSAVADSQQPPCRVPRLAAPTNSSKTDSSVFDSRGHVAN